jgi:hypothetical protein
MLTYPVTPQDRYLSPPIHTHAHAFPHQTINIAPHTILSPGVINASGQGNAHSTPFKNPNALPPHPLHTVNWSKSLDDREKSLSSDQQELLRDQHELHTWALHNKRIYEEQQKYLKDTRTKLTQSEKIVQDQFDVICQASDYLREQQTQLKAVSTKAKADQDNFKEILDEIRNECASIMPANQTLTTAVGVILDQFTFIFDTVELKHGPRTAFYLFRYLAPSIEKILEVTRSHKLLPELPAFEPSPIRLRRFDHSVGRLIGGIKYKTYSRAPGSPSYFEPLHSKEPASPPPTDDGNDSGNSTETLDNDDSFTRFCRAHRGEYQT